MQYIKSILIALFIFISTISYSQIGGLSASKLNSLSVGVVPSKKLEFEPSFTHYRSTTYWDNNSDKQNIFSTSDSIRNVSEMSFRFTYGLFDKLELGLSVSPNLSMSNWGLRYILYISNKIGVAAITGINIPLGNQDINKKIRYADNIRSFGVGGVMTYNISENFSTDFTAQYQFHLEETTNHDKNAIFLNFDIGYYIFKHQLQIISGFNYRTVKDDNGNHNVFTINPGITVETGKNFILVLNFPFDVMGKNELTNRGFGFAATILIN